MSNDTSPPRIIGHLNIYSLLALAGIIGPFILVASNCIAAAFVPGYSLLRNSVSSLAWTSMGWLQSIGFLAVGLLVEVFSVGLFFSIRRAWGFNLGIVLLACFGFGLMIIGAFREDPAGSPQTILGIIHTVTATAVFSLFPVASLFIAISLRKDPYWRGMFTHTVVTTCLATGFVAGNLILLPHLDYIGLYERILIANTIIWIEIMAIRLFVLSLTAGEKLKRLAVF